MKFYCFFLLLVSMGCGSPESDKRSPENDLPTIKDESPLIYPTSNGDEDMPFNEVVLESALAVGEYYLSEGILSKLAPPASDFCFVKLESELKVKSSAKVFGLSFENLQNEQIKMPFGYSSKNFRNSAIEYCVFSAKNSFTVGRLEAVLGNYFSVR